MFGITGSNKLEFIPIHLMRISLDIIINSPFRIIMRNEDQKKEKKIKYMKGTIKIQPSKFTFHSNNENYLFISFCIVLSKIMSAFCLFFKSIVFRDGYKNNVIPYCCLYQWKVNCHIVTNGSHTCIPPGNQTRHVPFSFESENQNSNRIHNDGILLMRRGMQ